MAVVISTGFMTAKGSLVSAIMYPPPVDFRFERDSYKFIAFLASLASVGFFYSLARKVRLAFPFPFYSSVLTWIGRVGLCQVRPGQPT